MSNDREALAECDKILEIKPLVARHGRWGNINFSCYLLMGDIYFYKLGNWELAKKSYLHAVPGFPKLDGRRLISCLFCIGIIHLYNNEVEKSYAAISHYVKMRGHSEWPISFFLIFIQRLAQKILLPVSEILAPYKRNKRGQFGQLCRFLENEITLREFWTYAASLESEFRWYGVQREYVELLFFTGLHFYSIGQVGKCKFFFTRFLKRNCPMDLRYLRTLASGLLLKHK